jgi:hypothetical protein
MNTNDLKEEKIRNLFSESLKLKLELLKILLTFTSIAIGIEVFVISNSSFDVPLFGISLKIIGLIILLFFIVWMGYYIYEKMNDVDGCYKGI